MERIGLRIPARPALSLLLALFLAVTAQMKAEVLLTEDFEAGALDSTVWGTNIRSPERGGFETRPEFVHGGGRSFRVTATTNGGNESGSNITHFFMPGQDKVYYRWYAKFAADFNQGNLMHWCFMTASRIDDKWSGFGKAGLRPNGTDFAVTHLEPSVAWGKYPTPGAMGFYTYWPDMKISNDGVHYYGNRFEPETPLVIERGKWYCFEAMVKLNEPGQADGEQAFWIDGKEIYHQDGLRWRDSDVLKFNAISLSVYIHQARQDNTCWFDDVAIGTQYIGPK